MTFPRIEVEQIDGWKYDFETFASLCIYQLSSDLLNASEVFVTGKGMCVIQNN